MITTADGVYIPMRYSFIALVNVPVGRVIVGAARMLMLAEKQTVEELFAIPMKATVDELT